MSTDSFSASYRGFSMVLIQPDQTCLKVFSSRDEEFMSIMLYRSDDLVKAISITKEMIDEFMIVN